MWFDGVTAYDLEVVHVNGDSVTYRCRNVPCRQWQAHPEVPGWSVQSRTTTLNEWKKYGSPIIRYKPIESPEWNP